MNKTFSNQQIYDTTLKLTKEFFDEETTIYLPVKFNFSLQKNFKALTEIAEIIETSRRAIGAKFGKYNEGYFTIKPEDLPQAESEMEKLMKMEQNIDITMITLTDLEDVKLSTKQMNAILFMIEE